MLNELTSSQAISIDAQRNTEHQKIVKSAHQKLISLLTFRTKNLDEKIQFHECWQE